MCAVGHQRHQDWRTGKGIKAIRCMDGFMLHSLYKLLSKQYSYSWVISQSFLMLCTTCMRLCTLHHMYHIEAYVTYVIWPLNNVISQVVISLRGRVLSLGPNNDLGKKNIKNLCMTSLLLPVMTRFHFLLDPIHHLHVRWQLTCTARGLWTLFCAVNLLVRQPGLVEPSNHSWTNGLQTRSYNSTETK